MSDDTDTEPDEKSCGSLPERAFKRLILGSKEPLPRFMQKHHEGLVHAYERCVGMLVGSIREFAAIERCECDAQAKDAADEETKPCKVDSHENREKVRARIASLSAEFAVVTKPSQGAAALYTRFAKLLEIDAKLIAAMPDDFLIARRWLLLDRFRRIAPQRAFIAYESAFPPSTDKQKFASACFLRADLLNLTNYMQQLYVLNVEREQSLASIKWWLLSRALLLVGIIALIFWMVSTPSIFEDGWWLPTPYLIVGLTLTFLTGAVGAIVSISRKFQDIAKSNVLIGDPMNEIVSLDSGRQSVAVSILSGGIFALLLYLFVVAGATSVIPMAGVFPSIQEQKLVVTVAADDVPPAKPNDGRAADAKNKTVAPNVPKEKKTVSDGEQLLRVRPADLNSDNFVAISEGMGFYYGADILRMMLLAFLAGFAERLVPDSIDRLIKREKDAQKT